MTRFEDERFHDVLVAVTAIRSYVDRGPLDDDLVFYAVRARFIEIGEAVKALGQERLAGEPSIAWSEIAKMRDKLAHHYFDASRTIVGRTVEQDLTPLENAVRRLLGSAGE